jgi:hypothetical protein
MADEKYNYVISIEPDEAMKFERILNNLGIGFTKSGLRHGKKFYKFSATAEVHYGLNRYFGYELNVANN